jgi:hypothetical protein
MVTAHHIFLYLLVEEKNGCITVVTRRSMSEQHTLPENHDAPGYYEICLKGHLNKRWANWFGEATLMLEDNGNTIVTCPVIDQAALHGLIKRVRDLGLPLLSVNIVSPDQAKPQEDNL